MTVYLYFSCKLLHAYRLTLTLLLITPLLSCFPAGKYSPCRTTEVSELTESICISSSHLLSVVTALIIIMWASLHDIKNIKDFTESKCVHI